MRIIISALFVLASFQTAAEIPGCEKCVDTPNIAPKAITSGKIAPDAVTRSKLAPGSVGNSELIDESVSAAKLAQDLQQKLSGLSVRDALGRRLPIVVQGVATDYASGYYRLKSGEVFPVVIARTYPGTAFQVHNSGQNLFTSYPQMYFTGPGCTGEAFVRLYQHQDPLFPLSIVADPEAPNRSRLIWRLGQKISPDIQGVSSLYSTGTCSEMGPIDIADFPRRDYSLPFPAPEQYEVIFEGSFRWMPPLSISAS